MSTAYNVSFFAVITDADDEQQAVEAARELANDGLCDWTVYPEADAPEEKLAHDARYGEAYRRLCKLYGPLDAAVWLLLPHKQLNGDTPSLWIQQGTPTGVLAIIDQLESGACA